MNRLIAARVNPYSRVTMTLGCRVALPRYPSLRSSSRRHESKIAPTFRGQENPGLWERSPVSLPGRGQQLTS
jgi:hypothetical protein